MLASYLLLIAGSLDVKNAIRKVNSEFSLILTWDGKDAFTALISLREQPYPR